MRHVLERRIAGIPALIVVNYFKRDTRQMGSEQAASEWDYMGYAELGYEICDTKGKLAPWLARKLSKQDWIELENGIVRELSA